MSDDVEPFDEEVVVVLPNDLLGSGFEDDGLGGLVEVAPELVVVQEVAHDANLTRVIDPAELRGFISALHNDVEEDLASRSEWERVYTEGLKALGLKAEPRSEPWPGATGVHHPVVAESVIAFQSNAAMELCPPSGPARSRVFGQKTSAKMARAARVAEELNFIITERMPDWRDEMEQLLFQLPLTGVQVKKVYRDPVTGRAASKRIPAQDFIVHDSAAGLSAPRMTHRQLLFKVDVRRLQRLGEYDPDVDLDKAPIPRVDDMTGAELDATGIEMSMLDDDRVEVYESHVMCRFSSLGDEYERPYIVTFLADSLEVLSVRRNWAEHDPLETRLGYFVKYSYFPAFGWYSYGLLHLIGGGAQAATALLRQLIDAGTLSNVPSGFKANTFRIKGNDAPLRPGEFRDVDVPGPSIRDALYPLPYKDPSPVLFQLLQNVVDEVRRVASVAEMRISDGSSEMPVGTTLALLERSLRVMTAVHARLHASMAVELNLIRGIVRDYMPPLYEHDTELGHDRAADFAAVGVLPVSDPNAASQAQRVITYTGAIQIASQAPAGVYDLPRLHRGFVEALSLPNAQDIVPLPEDAGRADPVSENQDLLNGKPVKAFADQDHEAHIRVHMALVNDPKVQEIVGRSPQAGALAAAMDAHVREHLAFEYRARLEREVGVPLPPEGEEMPLETEALIARLSAEAAEQLLRRHAQEAQVLAQAQAAADPVVQMQQRELGVKEQEVQVRAKDVALREEKMRLDHAVDLQKVELDRRALAAKIAAGQEDRRSRERQKGAELYVKAREGAKKGDPHGGDGSD